jgi:ankyrin repeat protein
LWLIPLAEDELKREQAEQARLEKERKATAQDRASARERAFAAARRGNLIELQEVVTKYNIDATASNKNKTETLLLAAAQSGDVSIVQWLVQRGADVDGTRKDGFNAFHIAIGQGHAALVKHLLEKHPKSFHPSKALPNGQSPLNLVVRSGSVETTQALVRFAPIPDVTKCWTDVDSLRSQADSDSDRGKWTVILDVLRTKVCRTPLRV